MEDNLICNEDSFDFRMARGSLVGAHKFGGEHIWYVYRQQHIPKQYTQYSLLGITVMSRKKRVSTGEKLDFQT